MNEYMHELTGEAKAALFLEQVRYGVKLWENGKEEKNHISGSIKSLWLVSQPFPLTFYFFILPI